MAQGATHTSCCVTEPSTSATHTCFQGSKGPSHGSLNPHPRLLTGARKSAIGSPSPHASMRLLPEGTLHVPLTQSSPFWQH